MELIVKAKDIFWNMPAAIFWTSKNWKSTPTIASAW